MRRRNVIVIATVAVVLAVVATELALAPRIAAVTPSPDGFTSDPMPVVRVDVRGLDRVRGLAVHLDGRDVTDEADVDGDVVLLRAGPLSDGEHVVTLSGSTRNLLRPRVSKTWRFTVDTQPPPLIPAQPTAGDVVTEAPLVVSGTTEPGTYVTASSGTEEEAAAAGADGSYLLHLALADGRRRLTLTARDKAGNRASVSLSVVVDTMPPEVGVAGLGDVVQTPTPRVRLQAHDDAGETSMRVRLDGAVLPARRHMKAVRLALPKLTEGRHTLTVTAVDRGGHTTRAERSFVVDSTEELGAATLTWGAQGRDVKELQSKLKKAGFFHRKPSGHFGRATERAVERFERKHDMLEDGAAGPLVIGALHGRLVVDLSECRLYLYLSDKLVTSYPVAVGQPAYPTPVGTFRVVSMAKNPTWVPPDSPWAKGLEPIPPGAGNPVGTRWIGTSAEGVGIHGTPADYSIGTHASHGCIRMHMWDVESLFEHVVVGMPVVVRP